MNSNNIKIIKTSILLSTSLFLLSTVFINICKNDFVEVKAYDTSSLPTTIYLNDTSDSNIRSYYSSLNALSSSERQGNNLLKNLKTLLKNGQKYYGYDADIWKMYEITDRDWAKSPASETTYGTYDSVNNKLTGYVYGSNENAKNDPYVHALYVNRNIENQVKAWGNHEQDQWGINREHVWAKSQGFETDGNGGARGDPMHLIAGNGYANNKHSNYFFGYVNTSTSYTNCGSTYSNLNGNYLGTSKTIGSGTVFEPQDCDKGDIARAIFYMAARYNYLSGSDSDGIDSNNPNLEIVNNTSYWENSSYVSTTSKTGKMGLIQDLLNWNRIDPPDEYEVHRNNLLYTNYTNNRNPFIDYPEWAEYIWGAVDYSDNSLLAYDSTPTGYASPSSDAINTFADVEIAVTGVSLNKSTTSMYAGHEDSLVATVYPINATNKALTWTSSDTDVATVSDGVITPLTGGSTVITVRTVDGGFTDACTVVVKNGDAIGTVEASSGSFSGWTSTGLGDAYTDGAARFDNSGDNIKKLDLFSGTTSSCMSSLTVTINAKNNGSDSESNSYKVEALTSNGTVLDSTTYTGLIGGSYADKEFTLDTNLTNCTGIRITYLNKASGNWAVKSVSWLAIYDSSPTSITASVSKNFKVGETITKSDVVVTDDLGNDIDDFSFSHYTFTYSDAASGGGLTEKILPVSYNELNTNLTVSVYREGYSINKLYDYLDNALTGVSGNSYTDWSEKTSNSDAVYAGTSAASYTTIQLNPSKNAGVISTASGGTLNKIVVEWNSNTASGRTLNIYGKDSAYSAISELFSAEDQGDLLGTIVHETSTELIVSGDYTFIGFRSNANALYLNNVTIYYRTTCANLSNYIMYEDTDNQCSSKLDVAISIFTNNLNSSLRNTFMTSNDYVIKQARERLEAWAVNKGKEIRYVDSDYKIVSSSNVNNVLYVNHVDNNVIVVVLSLSVLLGSICICLYFHKRKDC